MVASAMARIILFALVVCATVGLGSPAPEKRDAWSDQVVSLHNQARARYGARPVTWNSGLYSSTVSYAQACKFVHSDSQGKYGENLYAGTGNPGPGIADAVQSWMSEASKYDYSKPGFSAATGHFTQVVWKSTTQVTCALANCPANTIFPAPSHYIVCRYTPPGNYQGQFPQNVGRPV